MNQKQPNFSPCGKAPGTDAVYLDALRQLTGFGTFTWLVAENAFSVDSEFERVLGIGPETFGRGTAFEDYLAIVHPDDREAVRALVEVALRDGSRSFVSEHRLVGVGGEEPQVRWVAKYGRMHRFADGRPERMVGVFIDVTARHLEREALVRRQKFEAIATMTSRIAHDFNNVLGPILSYVDLVRREVRAGVSPEESLSEITRAATRAKEIVARLLAYTRDEVPARAQFMLCDVIAEACALMQPSIGRHARLTASYAAGLPPTFGDETLMHQVVVNLITNAIQALEDRPGEITVALDEVALGSHRRGLLDELAPGAYLRLRVTDTGPGIAARALDRLFDPFFTTKAPGLGTGIGLAAVQGAVRSHGGVITAENMVEHGARFTIYLPADREPDALQVKVPPAAQAFGEPHVMFVDDETPLLQLAARAMPLCGCTIDVFSSAGEALEALRSAPHAFDALITDFSMPNLNGLQLTQAIRELRPDIPVVLTSGFLTAEHRDAARQMAINAIVPKPCSINELADQVHRALAP